MQLVNGKDKENTDNNVPHSLTNVMSVEKPRMWWSSISTDSSNVRILVMVRMVSSGSSVGSPHVVFGDYDIT